MADVSLWQQSLETPQHLIDPTRLVTNLYECCLQLFLCFVKPLVPELDSSIQRRLHTQAQKFKLWGFSFNVREGELDQKLVGADSLRNALLPILSGMGETLITLSRRLNKAEELADTCSRFHLLKAQVSEVITQSSPDKHDTFPKITPDELRSLESEDSSVDEMAELEELICDTQSYNSCLFGLSSVLEDPAEKAIPGFDASQGLKPSNQELLKNSAWPYITNIIEAYPSIDRTFARRLGEANEVRYTRLQARRDHAQAGRTDTVSNDPSEKILQENLPSQSQSHVSSDLTAPSTRLSSVFDNTSSNPANRPKPRAPASVTTFASSVLEENSRKRNRGIPKMPEDQPWGTPFSCTVCGEYLENVWSSVQWVRHVYQDLQPYICSFADCSLGIQTFASRREWENHELRKHGDKWPKDFFSRASRETCPFCQTLQAGPRSQFMSHVGKHMQEVSHTAIPMSAMVNDDDDLELSDEEDNSIRRRALLNGLHALSLNAGAAAQAVSASRMGSGGPSSAASYGNLIEIYSPVGGALADIVFVHGLNGDPHSTWTSKKSETFWPAQLLPGIVEEQKARILTYGYDANLSSFAGAQSKGPLFNHAERLVASLWANRRLLEANERPLIFVAHSLGGLLVKNAVVYSAEIEHLRSIFLSTYGIIFLGTPHTSSSDAGLALYLERVSNATVPKKLIDTDFRFMDALEKNSEAFQDLNFRFLPLMTRFRIFCFNEGKPTTLKEAPTFIVDKESAAPMFQDVERATIFADHSDMCKFEDDSDPGFKMMAEAIQRYAGDAPGPIAERWKVEKEEMPRRKESAGNSIT